MFVLATELVGPEKRALAGTLVWFYFTAALMVLGLKVYFICNWRTLLIQVDDGLFGAVMAMRRTILNPSVFRLSKKKKVLSLSWQVSKLSVSFSLNLQMKLYNFKNCGHRNENY